jgi:multicomponent Na+:H+ antiporter subunit G
VIVELVLDFASWVLLLTGGAFVFIGGIGALRMPDFYTRMHAASLTDTLGTILVLLGIILQAGVSLAAVKLAAIMVFLLLTCPTAAYALANAARLARLAPERRVRDE